MSACLLWSVSGEIGVSAFSLKGRPGAERKLEIQMLKHTNSRQ